MKDKMKKLSYKKVTESKFVFTCHTGVNSFGQSFKIVSDGYDDHTLIAIFPSQELAFRTNFYDTEDYFGSTDYLPVVIQDDDGTDICVCEFEA